MSLNNAQSSSKVQSSIDQTISDFDGVTFHISTRQSKNLIQISIAVKCYQELLKYGAETVLRREYGQYIVEPEAGYDFSVQVDLESLPSEQEARDDLIRKISLLKRNTMAAPFEQAFDEYQQLHEEASKYTTESAPQGIREGGQVRAIHYRDEEAIYIKANFDRVTVIFSTIFKDETDRVFGKVFLQEFVDARRRAIQNAPQVLFRNDPPLEIQGTPGLPTTGDVGYVTFGITAVFLLTLVSDAFSTVPTSFDSAATARSHFSHPDLPRLLSLPHQGLQSIHTFAYAQANGRFFARYADPSYLHRHDRPAHVDFVQCCEERDPRRKRKSARRQAGALSRCRVDQKTSVTSPTRLPSYIHRSTGRSMFRDASIQSLGPMRTHHVLDVLQND